ncbi:SMC5-SMC6 complex kleisin component Non-SMC element 1 [Choristoneura fumiferana]|uniref:SMC5-SMC6 complex kleisin component Non-SMC element 1 n=1 Tax=Choristoneura fumiferana TaxID=7141 RepID=UPI003D15D749
MGKRKDKSSGPNRSSGSNTTRNMSGSHDRKRRLRSTLESFQKLEDDNATFTEKIQFTSEILQQAQAMLGEVSMDERVKHPGESLLASRVLRAAADMTAQCASAVSGGVHSYDRRALAEHFREHASFWNVPFPREAPAAAYLFGAFDAVPPEPRARPRRQVERQAVAEKKAPASVDKLEQTEESGKVTARVRHFVKKQYQQKGAPLSYFHLVLDPDSFCRSVENVYHMSFLVRGGAVAVAVDEEYGLPFVTPLAESAHTDLSEENQFIVSLDMQRWQELVKAFNIKQPMMVLKRN